MGRPVQAATQRPAGSHLSPRRGLAAHRPPSIERTASSDSHRERKEVLLTDLWVRMPSSTRRGRRPRHFAHTIVRRTHATLGCLPPTPPPHQRGVPNAHSVARLAYPWSPWTPEPRRRRQQRLQDLPLRVAQIVTGASAYRGHEASFEPGQCVDTPCLARGGPTRRATRSSHTCHFHNTA